MTREERHYLAERRTACVFLILILERLRRREDRAEVLLWVCQSTGIDPVELMKMQSHRDRAALGTWVPQDEPEKEDESCERKA